MNKHYPVLIKFLLSLIFCVATSSVFADPPSQVMRLGYMDGTVTYSPAGVDQWVNATTNRPVITGDKLWTDAGSKDELQLGSAVLRMNEYTSINVLNTANESPQIELDQGTINLHIWNMSHYKGFEIDTPNLAFSVNQLGDYRIDVNSTYNTTTVTVNDGSAVVYGESNSYQINAGQSIRFSGTQLGYEALALNEPDTFDKWCTDRNALYDNSTSKKYVSSEVIGATDLDSNGEWAVDSTYGNVWYPSTESSDWAPYSQGQWVWIDPWGWTWQDDQPWGFAPFHYGRWFHGDRGWGWIPGPADVEPVYAPALVAFYQGSGFDVVSGGVIGWFPLGPGDVYVPSYEYSRDYFVSVNVGNTIVNQAIINNVYSNPNQAWAYRNLNVPHAVTAVPTQAFVVSTPTAKSSITVPSSAITKVQPTHVAAVVPSNASVIGNAKTTTTQPSQAVLTKPIIAKTKPPAAPVPFATTKALLTNNPGQPLTASKQATLNTTSNPSASQVKVVQGHSTPAPISVKTGAEPNSATVTPAVTTQPSGAAHPLITKPQVIHKPSSGTAPKPAVINTHPQAMTPHPQAVTPHPQAVTPHPQAVTPHPQVVTPHPQAVTPHPQAVTPHPQAVTPHPQAVTPHPQAVTPHPQGHPEEKH